MKHTKRVYLYLGLLVVFLGGLLFSSVEDEVDFSERVKISLRQVGHQLLLKNKDTTSLVLPIKKIEQFVYKLSFQNEFAVEPNDLVLIVKENLKKAALPENYRVEVLQCEDDEVSYSYEVKKENEKEIVPCLERKLPLSCYIIKVKFIQKSSLFLRKSVFYLAIVLLLLIFLLDVFFLKSKKETELLKNDGGEVTKLGSFQFYPEQNKLVKQAVEINLSKKECELLAIFVTRPNEIIKREELTKKVWEDNGVFVGRSLDTYISKLRKILKEDSSLKITNIHGVGYKLEVD